MKGQPKTSDAARTAIASTKADLRELKSNSSATVQELQEFLRELKGKNPQEMLGVVASSQLIRATILSVILVTGALFALTAVPYFFGEKPPPDPEPVAVSTPGAPAPAPAPPVPDPKLTTPATAETTAPLAPLGLNEELPAPPNTNPLEDNGENFLKDLE